MTSFGDIRQVRIGAAVLWPQLNRLQRDGREIRLQPKVVETLVFLAGRQGKVVPRGDLLDHVWEGTFVKEEVVTTVVSQARRALGESAKDSVIETVPKRGYRLVAPVEFVFDVEPPVQSPNPGPPGNPGISLWKGRLGLAAVAVLIVVLMGAVAVLSSLRLTADSAEDERLLVRGDDSGLSAAERAFVRGRRFLDKGTFLGNENAVYFFVQALREDPGHAGAHAALARALRAKVKKYGHCRNLLDSALHHASEAVRLDERSAEAQRSLGDLEREMGHRDSALKAYLAAARLDPEDGTTAKRIAGIHKRNRDLDKVLYWLHRAMHNLPDDAQTASEIGMAYLSLDELPKAEKWLKLAVELEPMEPIHRVRLSTIYIVRGQWSQAEAPCLALLATLPDNEACLETLGERASFQGRLDEADHYFERILKRKPEHRYIRFRMAYHMLEAGRQEEARESLHKLRQSILGQEEERLVWSDFWILAAISSVQGRSDEAARWLDRTLNAGRLLYRWDASDPVFRPLRGSPGYQQYLERMKERVNRLRQRAESPKLTRSIS